MGNVKMGKKRADNSGERKHLTEEEVELLIKCASRLGRNGHRDGTMIRVAFRHGLRVSELVNLQKSAIDFGRKNMHVGRLKGSLPSTHDMTGPEMRDLRRVLKESPDPSSRYVFISEQKCPMNRRTFGLIVERAGKEAGIPLDVHPHMLRHACGYAMANRGIDTRAIQAWLGHSNISMTARYTALAPDRLRGLW
jgi:integrase